MNLTFAPERLEDRFAVESMTRDAFWDGGWTMEEKLPEEHYLVHLLRQSPLFIPELNLVAWLDGKIVGHVIYTKARLEDINGVSHDGMVTFGPLTVHPDVQSQGIARALLSHSFGVAKKLGYKGVAIYGHPNYYPRVGFVNAKQFGITTADGKNFDAFMAYPLYDDALEGMHGMLLNDPVYENIPYKDVCMFDKQFPEKLIHKPISAEVLLAVLNDCEQKALSFMTGNALKMMTTRSEQEIRMMDGVTDETIESIDHVMRAHGYGWRNRA